MGREAAVFAGRNPEKIVTLEWLPTARRDFASIVDYIADDDPAAAIEQGDEIGIRCVNASRRCFLLPP